MMAKSARAAVASTATITMTQRCCCVCRELDWLGKEGMHREHAYDVRENAHAQTHGPSFIIIQYSILLG